MCKIDEEVDAYLGWKCLCVENMLCGHWVAVQAVANALLREQKLGYQKTRATIEKAGASAG
jgi:hypothetical protein